MSQLQKVLESLETACGNRCNAEYKPCHYYREAIAIVKQMMQAEPVCVVPQYELDYMNDTGQTGAIYKVGGWAAEENEADIPLFAAPQAVPAWLPIESAPKPSGRVLLAAEGQTCYGHWYSLAEPPRWEYDGYAWGNPKTQPTHWMPLPAALKGAA